MGHSKSSLKTEGYIAIQSYFRKEEKYQINNITLNLKQLEKEQTKSIVGRRKETIKMRAEINKTEKNWKGSMKLKADSLKKFKKLINL